MQSHSLPKQDVIRLKTEKQIQQRISDLKQLASQRLKPELTPHTTIRVEADIAMLEWVLAD